MIDFLILSSFPGMVVPIGGAIVAWVLARVLCPLTDYLPERRAEVVLPDSNRLERRLQRGCVFALLVPAVMIVWVGVVLGVIALTGGFSIRTDAAVLGWGLGLVPGVWVAWQITRRVLTTESLVAEPIAHFLPLRGRWLIYLLRVPTFVFFVIPSAGLCGVPISLLWSVAMLLTGSWR